MLTRRALLASLVMAPFAALVNVAAEPVTSMCIQHELVAAPPLADGFPRLVPTGRRLLFCVNGHRVRLSDYCRAEARVLPPERRWAAKFHETHTEDGWRRDLAPNARVRSQEPA